MTNLHTRDLAAAAVDLHAGDRIFLNGIIYTARDAAHKKLFSLLDQGKALPFPIRGSVIYHAGPTPAQSGLPVGSCGPTTSSRMDPYAPRLFDLGLCAVIGKGERSQAVVEAIIRNHGVYLCAVGGAGALIAGCIQSSEEIAFAELGCESIKRFEIKDFPLTVAIDCHGGNLFQSGKFQFKK